jgi:sugar phosphate isomerase/epimerase
MAPDWRGWIQRTADTGAGLGLSFVQAHSSDSVAREGSEKDTTMEAIKREFEACRILGIRNMVVHCVSTKSNTWKEQREINVRFYNSLLPVIESTEVNCLIENGYPHNNTIDSQYWFQSADHILALLSDLGRHPLIHACWDVGHAAITNVDQYKEITGLGSELRGLHIQDNFGTEDIHLAPFAGTCCYDAILKGLVDSAYKGYFTMETY